MPVFDYKARKGDGTFQEGELEAGGRQDAFRQIETLGLRPIRLTERNGSGGPASGSRSGAKSSVPKANGSGSARSGSKPGSKPAASEAKGESAGGGDPGAMKISLGGNKITPRMLENFTRLLSSLLSAGVPLSRALVILHKEASTPAAGAKWKEIHDSVVDGVSLADSMARSPDTFPRVYVAMVEAGETGGFLDVVLGQIADFQAREKEMKGKVMTALLYPVILLVLALAVLIFLLVFFIPRFQSIFSGFGAKLPLLTQMIVSASEFLRTYGLFFAAAVGIGIYMFRSWLVSESGRRVWEGAILKAPVVGSLVAQFAMARFCRMLGTLLGAGVPLIGGLNVARRSIGNQILVDAVTNSIERVKEGHALARSLGECRTLFGGATLEMISVAEESGKLDQELVRIANVTEGDLDRQLKSAVALAEPLMLFLIAGFIGIIFIGMVIPIFSLQDHIK